jgi:hypothetical protein
MSFEVRHYEIHTWWHELQGTCKKISCADGQSVFDECSTPWTLPPPTEPPPDAL